MKHWIVDVDDVARANWQEAMPEAILVKRTQLANISDHQPGVVWCRLRAGESLALLASDIACAAPRSVVILSDAPDEALVVEALSAGAAGCCNTHAAPDVLRQIAMVVGNGGLWVGQSLLQRLVGSTARLLAQRAPGPDYERPANDWASLLSEREAQVARLVAAGSSNKEVASQLSITERTVKAHLTAVFEKLELRDRLQLSLRINGLAV